MKNNSKSEAEALWAWLETQANRWWKGGKPFAADFGWVELYETDNWHCIYCGRDLAENEDVLAESTVEHLVPHSLFAAGKQNAHFENNLAASCAGYNGLKGPHVPLKDDPAWASRKSYIAAMRKFIANKRAERAARNRVLVFNNHAKRIWTAATPRQRDYLGT